MYLYPISTVHLNSNLYQDEQILLSQDGVGVYRGKSKEPSHPSGMVHLTTHRIIYQHATQPDHHSFYISFKDIRQTESWIRFFRSSPKITLLLGPSSDSSDVKQQISSTWICSICAFSNTAQVPKCTLCGVARSISQTSTGKSSPAATASTDLTEFVTDQNDIRISCPACTFLNHPSLSNCEVCGASLLNTRSWATTPPTSNKEEEVRLSFRQGGDKKFYDELKRAISRKAWATLPPTLDDQNKPEILIGIDGIIKRIDIEAETTRSDLQSAFADLDTLMYRYKDALSEAQALSAKLELAQSTGTDTSNFKSTLMSLGLVEPAVMAGDEVDLCRELVGVLNGRGVRQKGGKEVEGLLADDRGRGIMGLDEVWCAWNRARRVSLVSPEDLLRACRHLHVLSGSPSLQLKTFPSGLSIVYTPYYASDSLFERISSLITYQDGQGAKADGTDLSTHCRGISTMDVSMSENLNILLTQELLEDLEAEGSLSRDDAGENGTMWFQNLFTYYTWKDPN